MRREYLKPTNDIIIKLLFGEIGRADILKDLLEAILKIDLNKVIVIGILNFDYFKDIEESGMSKEEIMCNMSSRSY